MAQVRNTQSRGWCLTINNYKEEDISTMTSITKADYIIYGKEVGEKGTPHLQCYIFRDAKFSFKQIKRLFPTAHIEPSKGTPEENQLYCSKEGNFVEIGECPKQGKRSDLDEIKVLIKDGKGMKDVIDIAHNTQQVRFAEMALKYYEKKRNWKPSVKWYHGKTGVGKSRRAAEELPEAYRKTEIQGKWWEGYDAHEDVIIDDLKSEIPYNILLDLLDRYETRVECKGSTRQFLAKRIIITSIGSPHEIYGQHIDELMRRIDTVEEIFKGMKNDDNELID